MLPDDYRYKFIEEACDMIADATEDSDLDDLVYEMEASIDIHDLTAWLASRTDRYDYVDEAICENGGFLNEEGRGILDAIGMGQVAEKQEVFFHVLSALRERAEEIPEYFWGHLFEA